MSEPLWRRDATELARLLRRREVSAREVMQAHLDRIDDQAPADSRCRCRVSHSLRFMPATLQQGRGRRVRPAAYARGRMRRPGPPGTVTGWGELSARR